MQGILKICVLFGMTVLFLGCAQTNPQADKVSNNPPKVGEHMDHVTARLGSPDGGKSKVQDEDSYVTSYTDSSGTIHHLTVEEGVITRVVYTGSR